MNSSQGKRNRVNGHNFEREIRKKWYEAGWLHVVTSRSESKNADDNGLDLVHTAPFAVQCKYSKVRPNYIEILANMPAVFKNLLFHKQPKGKTYVVMEATTFWEILKHAKEIPREGKHDLSVLPKRSSKPESNKTNTVSKTKGKKEQ